MPSRWTALLLLAVVGLAPSARAEKVYQATWKIPTTALWPPVVVDSKVILKTGDTLAAFLLGSGKQVWSRKLEGLRYGKGVMAGGAKYIYVLGNKELILVDAADGSVFKKKPVTAPRSVMTSPDSVYVAGSAGVFRYDHAADALLGSSKGPTGDLRGVDGDHVVIYAQQPRRLRVVNLKKKKKAYQFKLLPTGWHQVISVGKDRLCFIDYSQRTRNGSNPRKLYYTEADYTHSKKLKDEALARKYPVTYPLGSSDKFSVSSDAAKIIFLGNHGRPGEPSSLVAYDPAHDKILWNRSGEVLSSGILMHKGRLWTTVASRDGTSHAVAYSPDDGNIILRIPLDFEGQGQPVAAGSGVLFRTRRSVIHIKPVDRLPTPASPSAASPVKARPGWRLYRDRIAGYLIQTPKSWEYNRAGLKKMGGIRMSIPFVRRAHVGGRAAYLGSIHLLTWEAAGRRLQDLWQSVYTQQRQLNPSMRVVKVKRILNIGGSGFQAIKAIYTYKNSQGYSVQLRSLCIIANNVAYELRGWASPLRPRLIWQEIEQIFRTFRPHKF